VRYKIFFQFITVIFLAFLSTSTYACTKAQMVDFDYEIKEILGGGYSTFGRLWMLDGEEACVESCLPHYCAKWKSG